MSSRTGETFPGTEDQEKGDKNEKDMLVMERDAKFNAWLQRKAILDSSYEYLKLLDSNRGKDRDQTIDIAVSLLAVDRLLDFSSKNVETTMMTVKASLEAKKEQEIVDAAAGNSNSGLRASVQGLPLAAPWRPGGLRKAPGRMPAPLVTTYLSVAAKKGEAKITVNAAEGCMKGMWVQLGEWAADLCKIASSNGSHSVLELYKPGLHQDHPIDTVVKVYTSDNWKSRMDFMTSSADARETEAGGAMTKSMKQVWMKWTMEHHTLHDVGQYLSLTKH